MSQLALSALFEYLCYGSTAIINVSLFRTGIDFRRQNMTSLVDHRSERLKYDIINHNIGMLNPLTSRPGCMPGSRYTSVGVLFFVI